MAKARTILRRTKAVKSIRSVTKTMEMISTARFKRMHKRAAAARPYTDLLCSMVSDLLSSGSAHLDHPLLKPVEQKHSDVLLVLTSNRGLCGSYNYAMQSIACDRMEQVRAAGYQVQLRVVGKRGVGLMKSSGYAVDKAYTDFEAGAGGVDYARVAAMADELMADFLAGRISGVEVAYTQLVSAGRFKPSIAQILPLAELAPKTDLEHPKSPMEFELMPSAGEILNKLLPATVRLRLFQCFLDASVTEQISRMTAMRSATEAADERIHSLTVFYNRLRQSQITTELSEIIGGRAGVE